MGSDPYIFLKKYFVVLHHDLSHDKIQLLLFFLFLAFSSITKINLLYNINSYLSGLDRCSPEQVPGSIAGNKSGSDPYIMD